MGGNSTASKFPLYACDYVKNTECPKTSCKYNPNAKYGECTNTSKKKFARLDEHGKPIVVYANMTEAMAEFNALEHTSSGLLDD